MSLTAPRPSATGQPLPYDPHSSFSWIINPTGCLFGVAARADRPWRSWAEFVSCAKAHPGKLSYGTPGVGTPLRVAMEPAARQEGIEWTHVPFRGGMETLQAALGGHVDAMVDASGWAPLVEEARLRLLVAFGAERSKRFPGVQTLREAGLDCVSYAPCGIAGPKGMDAGVVRALHDGFREALFDPAHLAVLDRYDMPVRYLASEECAAFARRRYEEDLGIVRRLGLRPV